MVYFIDLDGTLVYHGTNNPLPGAVEWLAKIQEDGSEVVITTRRGEEFHPKHVYGSVQPALDALKIKPKMVIKDCGSPRMIVNDEECYALKRETNEAWV